MRIHHGIGVTQALESMPRLERLGLGAELYLEPVALENWLDDAWQGLAADFARLSVSFHAPFWNLDLLSPDPGIARLSQRRLEQALHAVSHFTDVQSAPVHVVVHSGIPHGRTSEEALGRAERMIAKLEPLLESARDAGAALCLENTHEPDPDSLNRVLEALPELRFCFDAAHAQVFSRTPDPSEWLALSPAHLHLNDNHGEFDEHLTLGAGILPHATWLPAWAERAPLVLEVRGDPTASVRWLQHTLGTRSERDLEPRVLEALTVG
jgi:sugar phosphate isomerase/epimerase